MRPLVLLVALCLAGCGTLLPYSLAPDWLAPDVVPERAASAVVLVEKRADVSPSVLRGRVVDLATGQPIAGASVSVTGLGPEAPLLARADGSFAVAGDGAARLRVEAPGYAPADGAVAASGSTTVLVMLNPLPAEPATEGA